MFAIISVFWLENNDLGSTYNSAEVNLFSALDDQLYALIPENQTNFTSSADLVANWGGISILAPPGEVENGWNGNFNTDGSLDLTHIGGIPGLSYDNWTQTDSGSDYMFFEKPISKDLLEFEGSIGQHEAEGQYFTVQVPEPSQLGLLLGLGALGWVVQRRRRA